MSAKLLYAAFVPVLPVIVLLAAPSECATSDSPRVQALRHQNAGFELARQGLLAEAIAEYNRGIAVDPNVGSLYYNRGRAYTELSDYQSALADLNKAIELEADAPQYYYQRAVVFHAVGSSDQARSDIEAVLSMTSDPDVVYPAQTLLARIIGGD
ncbi:MAG TPA: tetratricopeptide repeat protein [Dehalococcoidia bacterium]|nr:tetratricopeptide repeat protein [Dehalococcoidia bacterium]